MCIVLGIIKWGNLFINYFDIREWKQNKSPTRTKSASTNDGLNNGTLEKKRNDEKMCNKG